MTDLAVLDLPADATDPRVSEPIHLAESAAALIVTRDTKPTAEHYLLALADAERQVRAVMDPICDAAFVAHRKATAARGELLKPIEDARKYLRAECGRIQRELEAEAAAEARRKADEAAAAERARLQAEAEALADTDIEDAMDVLQQADEVVPVVVPSKPAVAAGLAYRDNWIPQYVDAKGRPIDTPDVRLIPVQYLKVDEVAIRRVVAAMKDRTTIPGVRAVNDRKPVGTGRR